MQDHTMKNVVGMGLALLAAEVACGGKMLVVSDDRAAEDAAPSASAGTSGSGGSAGSGATDVPAEALGGGTNLGVGPWGLEGSLDFLNMNGRCPMIADIQNAFDARFAPSSVEPQHVGHWEGFIADAAYDDYYPSDIVTLDVALDGTGSIVFGSGAAPIPPADSGEGYLCSATAPPAPSTCNPAGFVEGVRYPVRSVVSDGIRLTLGLTADEPWSSWCELQAPRRASSPASNPCAYGFGPDVHDFVVTDSSCFAITESRETLAVDCAYLNALTHISCACAEDGCIRESAVTMIDIALFDDDSGMIGTLGEALSVQFRRF